uniref:CCHC-type domain-containing protein n=1 Tax=Theileria parva TaxID=5875 RepID=Q4N8A2_THEPA|eukprot:XP_766089.1 hypothetical protein [Theileria parva strain Muguga]
MGEWVCVRIYFTLWDQEMPILSYNIHELPYASCFVCGERGHLSSQCPENPKGIFPKGSGCHFCGSVRHKKANCPEYTKSHQSSNN